MILKVASHTKLSTDRGTYNGKPNYASAEYSAKQ